MEKIENKILGERELSFNCTILIPANVRILERASDVYQFSMIKNMSTSPRVGKRKLVCVLFVHLFVCFVRVRFYHFSLPLGVRCGLRFVIVALPGLFY